MNEQIGWTMSCDYLIFLECRDDSPGWTYWQRYQYRGNSPEDVMTKLFESSSWQIENPRQAVICRVNDGTMFQIESVPAPKYRWSRLYHDS